MTVVLKADPYTDPFAVSQISLFFGAELMEKRFFYVKCVFWEQMVIGPFKNVREFAIKN